MSFICCAHEARFKNMDLICKRNSKYTSVIVSYNSDKIRYCGTYLVQYFMTAGSSSSDLNIIYSK